MPAKKLPVTLLDDLPATDDAFGGHQGIANAAYEMITSEKGGRAVALVGPWGSGKSTVVRLLQRAADRPSNRDTNLEVEVFVFDAWAHEGDPLRRSFLERLIGTLQLKNWIDTKKWASRLDELARRKKRSETTSSPVFTASGVLMLLLLYLVPLAVVLVRTSHEFWHKYRVLALGIALYFFPLAWAVYYWRTSKSSDDTGAFNLLGMLFNRSVQRTTTDALETPEPTSVEFQQLFRELASEALGGAGESSRRLVIVIDNLDRIEANDALELWSAMSAFVEIPSGDSPCWAQRVWTVVPFDEKSIKMLWTNNPDGPAGEAFLAKTFQLRFGVPPPLLSDWSAFLLSQLRLAFPEHDSEQFYGISRVFGLLCADRHVPYPRDIKNFVNQIGTTYRSHPEEIPLVVHAIYAALIYKGSARDPSQPVPAKEELTPYVGRPFDAELAALHYNVPSKKALQAIYGPQVENLLADGDADGLFALLDKPGLDHVVFRAVQQRSMTWANREPFKIGRAAYACKTMAAEQSASWQEIWGRLENAARAAKAMPTLDKVSGAGLSILIERRNSEEFSKQLLRCLSAEQPSAGPAIEVERWFEGLAEILVRMINIGHESLITSALKIGQDPQTYLGFVGIVWTFRKHRDLVRYLRPAFGVSAVISLVAGSVQGNGYASYENVVSAMLVIPDPIPPPDTKPSDWIHVAPNAKLQMYVVACVDYSDQDGTVYATCATYRFIPSGQENTLDPYGFSCQETPSAGTFQPTFGGYCEE